MLSQDPALHLHDIEPRPRHLQSDDLRGQPARRHGDGQRPDALLLLQDGGFPLRRGDAVEPADDLGLLRPVDRADLPGEALAEYRLFLCSGGTGHGLRTRLPRPPHDAEQLGIQVRLEVADRQGQKCPGPALHDAEPPGEFRQGRICVGPHRQGKLGGIAEGAPRLVPEIPRKAQGKFALLGKGSLEEGAPDIAGVLVIGPDGGLEYAARLRLQGDRSEGRRGYRRREAHCHRQERDAGPVRILPGTAEFRPEGTACLEGEDLVLLPGQPRFGPDAGLPDEAHRRFVGKHAACPDHHDPAPLLLKTEGLHDSRPLLPRQDRDSHAVSDPGDGEIDVLHDRLFIRLAVEEEDEGLVRVDALTALPGPRAQDRGAARCEGVGLRAGEPAALQVLQARSRLEAAGDPRRKVPGKIIDPVPGVHPAPASLFRAGNREGIRQPGISEGNHGRGESDCHLPDVAGASLGTELLDARCGGTVGRRH